MNKDKKCNKCNHLQNGVCIIYGFVVDKPDTFACEDYEMKGEKEPEKNKCCLCGGEYTGWGNNAWPLKDGYCCYRCNMDKVLPARMAQVYGGKK